MPPFETLFAYLLTLQWSLLVAELYRLTVVVVVSDSVQFHLLSNRLVKKYVRIEYLDNSK